MNEQNIQNIIAYFTQNPNQDPDKLIQNLIASGYPRIDIDESLIRLGITPEVLPEIPIETEKKMTETKRKRKFPFLILILAIGFILIIALLIFFGKNMIGKYTSRAEILPTPTTAKLPSPTSKPVTNPVISTQQILAKGSYNVTIEQEILDQDPQKKENSTVQYFFNDGLLVRFEHSSGIIMIVKNNTIYMIDTNKKKYSTYASTAENKTVLKNNLKEADVIGNLLENTQKGIYQWKKISEIAWKGTNKQTNHTFTVQLDVATKLLKVVTEYDEKNTLLSRSTIMIKPSTISAAQLEVPQGFTRVETIQ